MSESVHLSEIESVKKIVLRTSLELVYIDLYYQNLAKKSKICKYLPTIRHTRVAICWITKKRKSA